MANTKAALKRNRQAERRRQHNVARRSAMRSQLKTALQALETGGEVARAEYTKLCAMLDRLAGKRLIHKNKAARHKRNLAARLRTASTS